VILGARRTRRAAVVAALLVLSPPMLEWWQRRPGLDPVRWAAASIADDLAYGSGVWAGCISARTISPLLPALGRTRSTASVPPPSTGTTPLVTPGGRRMV
jgi:mycofactocin glycosyltransferase